LSAKSRHWTYFSRQRVWQSRPCANACQKRPKPREIRIAPVIFLFIDFFSFGKALEPRFRHKHESRLPSSAETVKIVSNTGSKLLVWQRQNSVLTPSSPSLDPTSASQSSPTTAAIHLVPGCHLVLVASGRGQGYRRASCPYSLSRYIAAKAGIPESKVGCGKMRRVSCRR
jgi:hypothetical protein